MEIRSYANSVSVTVPVHSGESARDKMHKICEWGIDTLTGCIEVRQIEFNATQSLKVLCEFEEDATLVALRWV